MSAFDKLKELVVFDHVEAKLNGNVVTVTNPTKFDANVRVFADRNSAKAYQSGFISTCPAGFVKSGETKQFSVGDLENSMR